MKFANPLKKQFLPKQLFGKRNISALKPNVNSTLAIKPTPKQLFGKRNISGLKPPVFIKQAPPIAPVFIKEAPIEMPVFEDVLPKSDSVNYAQNIKKTISFTVADDNETLPGANIAVDGIGKAQTDINGNVTIPNISLDASIKITYVGYDDYITTASTIPSVVILKKGITMLSEVVVEKKSPKASSNNSWMWWIVGAVAAVGIYKYSKTGAKVVRAKI